MRRALLALALTLAPGLAAAQASNAELAKQLANPVASLVSVPFQLNWDEGFGENDGHRWQLNVQPVMPFSISPGWNVISRTILPIIWQDDVVGSGSQSGIGDITQSFFFSPKAPGPGGTIWGAGPVFLLPTATDDALGAEKWGLGPTFVGLRQTGPWTYGLLANHIWSVAGDDDRQDLSNTFVQPFLNYTTPNATSFILQSESTYDWKASEWTVPINAMVTHLFEVNGQRLQLGGGVRYWATAPEGGPEGWGFRAVMTFLFPT
jgi:hypothetical protein